MAMRAKRTTRRPSRRCRLATQMRHGCGLIRRLNGVQGMGVVKRDKRRPGISHKAATGLGGSRSRDGLARRLTPMGITVRRTNLSSLVFP
jgi:hypothetical protein